MPELTIKSLPTQPAAGTGTANGCSQSDPASPASDHGTPIADDSSASSFAAVLKSQVDKKSAAAVAEGETSAAEIQTNAGSIAGTVYFSAVFQLVASSLAEKTTSPTGTTEGNPESNTTSDRTQAAVPQSHLPEAPPSILAIPLSAPILDAAPAKQLPGAIREAVATMGASHEIAQALVTEQAPGKVVPGSAITAGTTQTTTDGRASERSGPEFRALTEIAPSDLNGLMERTANMGPISTSRMGGATQIPGLHVETPMGQRHWQDEVGQKLTWMVGNNRQQADLVLTPPQLGRIEVSLTMNGDQASAIFTSPNPAVREALEGSLQRLREVLADAGVSLGQTHVGSESPNQSARREDREAGTNNGARYAEIGVLHRSRAHADTSAGRGMIDIFA